MIEQNMVEVHQTVTVTKEQHDTMRSVTDTGIVWFKVGNDNNVYANETTDASPMLHVVEPNGDYWWEVLENDGWNRYREGADGEREQFWEED